MEEAELSAAFHGRKAIELIERSRDCHPKARAGFMRSAYHEARNAAWFAFQAHPEIFGR